MDAALPAKPHRVPAPPGELARVAPEFLAALHECGRSAARQATRFALDRVQVRGRAGQVVGTDGRQALVWAGLRLAVADDVLVPAVSVFGAPDLAGVRAAFTVAAVIAGVAVAAAFLTGRQPAPAADVENLESAPSQG